MTPEESLKLRVEPGHLGVSISPLAVRRRRANVDRARDDRRLEPDRRSTRSKRRSTMRSSRPATVRCARCSGCASLLLTADQAKLLKAKQGDAGLFVERLGYLRDGRAIGLSQSFYRGDTYDFVAELNAFWRRDQTLVRRLTLQRDERHWIAARGDAAAFEPRAQRVERTGRIAPRHDRRRRHVQNLERIPKRQMKLRAPIARPFAVSLAGGSTRAPSAQPSCGSVVQSSRRRSSTCTTSRSLNRFEEPRHVIARNSGLGDPRPAERFAA